jgi:hypothetical protein
MLICLSSEIGTGFYVCPCDHTSVRCTSIYCFPVHINCSLADVPPTSYLLPFFFYTKTGSYTHIHTQQHMQAQMWVAPTAHTVRVSALPSTRSTWTSWWREALLTLASAQTRSWKRERANAANIDCIDSAHATVSRYRATLTLDCIL